MVPVTQDHQTAAADWRTRSTITVEEAASVLGIGRASAYAAASAGDLPVIRLGRRLLVPVGALRRLLGEIQNDNDPAGNRAVAKEGAGAAHSTA
jgi:excisionase family DNA binding protein